MSNSGPLDFEPPKVIGVEDADIDPDGYIPLKLLLAGIDVVVPLWPSYATAPDDRDRLTVFFDQPGQPLVAIVNDYTAEDIQPQFVIHIDARYLQVNGAGQLWYEVLDTSDHPSSSEKRKLTIDHTPVPIDLEAPNFLDKDYYGYLNCKTDPPLREGVRISVPPLAGFRIGDRVELLWRGYSSLNASGVEYVGARKKDIRSALNETDIEQGYTLHIQPYDVHIKPMYEKASATAVYRIFRGRKLVGASRLGWVKIDQVIPGD